MCFLIEARSRKDLSYMAAQARAETSCYDKLYMDVVPVLDRLCHLYKNFNYQILADNELPANLHALTDIVNGEIVIKESVYNRACEGHGRDRMTIAHEIGHFYTILQSNTPLQEIDCLDGYPAYRNPEWQAACMAAEFLAPSELIKDLTPVEISNSCGISLEAANNQWLNSQRLNYGR